MYRLKKVEEVYKGKYRDSEKKDVIIQQWSPNNLRKVVIGDNVAFLEYHIENSKAPQKVVKIDLQEELEKDIELMQTNPNKYKPLISFLMTARVSSNIEEIVFLPMRNSVMFSKERNITLLGNNLDSVKSKFPRLSCIYTLMVNQQEQEVLPMVLKSASKSPTRLLVEFAKEGNINISEYVMVNERNWYSNYNLRPQYYSMDKDTLRVHFDRIKMYRQREEESKLEEKKIEGYRKTLNMLRSIYETFIKRYIVSRNRIYDTASNIAKMEYLYPLSDKEVKKIIRKSLNTIKTDSRGSNESKEVKGESKFVNNARRINYTLLKDFYLAKRDNANPYDQSQTEFITFIEQKVLKEELNVESYKLERNKIGVDESIKYLEEVYDEYINILVDTTGVAYINYLGRNGEKHIPYYLKQSFSPLESFYYPYSMRVLSHNIIGLQTFKTVCNKINATELSDDRMSREMRISLGLDLIKVFERIK